MGYLIQFMNYLISFLPDDKFIPWIEALKLSSDVLGYFNYFIPVKDLINITDVWIVLIIAYRFFFMGKSTLLSIGKSILKIDLGDLFRIFG